MLTQSREFGMNSRDLKTLAKLSLLMVLAVPIYAPFVKAQGPSLPVGAFSLAATPATATVVAGASTQYHLVVAPTSPSVTARVLVALRCNGGPSQSTCSVSPATVSVAGTAAKATVTVATGVGSPKGTFTLDFTGTILDVGTTGTTQART